MENIVKKLRGNLSQAELAKKIGMSQEVISRYEAGRFPKPATLDKIAAAVGKKVEWIIKELNEEDEESVLKRRHASDTKIVSVGTAKKGQNQFSRTREGERRQFQRRNALKYAGNSDRV